MRLSHFIILLAIGLLQACSHPLEIVGEGDIVSATGERNCSLEDFQAGTENCVENLVVGEYRETYTAAPRAGWAFVGWKGCGDQYPDCRMSFGAKMVREHWFKTAPPLIAQFSRLPNGIEVTSADDFLVGGAASALPEFSLYVFDGDLSSPGASKCAGACAASWPPLLVSDGVASGVSGLGTIDRNDGSVQATFDGRPLYFFVGDKMAGDTNGGQIQGWHLVSYAGLGAVEPLFDASTSLEPVVSYVRDDGVVVTRFGDRGRDRHAKDIGMYDPNNIFNSDHYDHWLAHYWEYRTARVQLEDHVPNGTSLIRATYITEHRLSAKEFRVWFFGLTTTGQFHFNPSTE